VPLRQTNEVIKSKIARINEGKSPRVLDLFSGCGGISLGFHAAGFEIVAAVEIDATAAATHAMNFHGGSVQHGRARDITVVEPEDLSAELGLGKVEEAFDILVGGPPCQAYARVGRAKLREVSDHPEAYKVDPRGNLYLRYLHYIRKTQPLAVLVENVPDALNYGGHNVIEEIAEVLNELGYDAKYTLTNTAFHGVPQMRERVFLIALHRSLDVAVGFPTASRHLNLPSGYAGSRAVALKNVGLFQNGLYVEADTGTDTLPGPVTTREALSDLAPITLHLEGMLKRGARKFDTPVPYAAESSVSTYASLMRHWEHFEAPVEGVRDHVIRLLPRDTDIFRFMPSGGEYPAAHATAVDLWRARIASIEQLEQRKLPLEEQQELYGKMVPPYPVHNFPNRWWKLKADFPSRTLMAHIGKDTYSHIHYDSNQARVISVREAARLQSFPDGFVFCGSMNAAYRQIGNAVPPLMAKRLASQIFKSIQAGASSFTQSVAAE
jgi:DNA (cytosine-5)-methyltransferase 1